MPRPQPQVQVQGAAAEGEGLAWAGVAVQQARGVVPGYGQVKVPVTFAPQVDGERRAGVRGGAAAAAAASSCCRRRPQALPRSCARQLARAARSSGQSPWAGARAAQCLYRGGR
jgi:hypothetical protein